VNFEISPFRNFEPI